MEPGCEYSRLTIPTDPSYASVASAYVGEISRNLGFNELEQSGLRAALIEAVKAVIQIAFEPGERQTLDISCQRVPGGLEIIIKEKGLPFDAAELTANVRSTPDEDIFQMRNLVDEISIQNLGPEGMEIHLIKYLKDQTLNDYIAACEPERFHPIAERPKSLKKLDFEIRLMRPSEAIEVARSVYKAYGYSYFYEHAYYPERMIELNNNGQMTSAVAVTSGGEVVGHCAIFRSERESRVAEIGQAVTKPEFRGHGCLLKLTEFLVDRAKRQRLKGLYVRAVTNHTFSQRVAARLGFRTCGLLLGYAPSSVSFKGITEQLSQRETFMIAYRFLEKEPDLNIYAPPQHGEFIANLYDQLGVKVIPVTPASQHEASPPQEPILKIKSSVFIPAGVAIMQVTRYGQNIVEEVKHVLKQLCLKQFDLILIYLNMMDPGTFHLTQEFEKLGFFFSGILPGTSNGEILILQYLNNVPIDYEQIKLDSEMRNGVLNYIRREDPNYR